MRSMMFSLNPERQKPRFAKNEAFEGGSKVGEDNPVGQHITLYDVSIQVGSVIYQTYNALAVGQMPTRQSGLWFRHLKNGKQNPSSDLPLSTWPMKQPLADRFADRMLRESNLRGTIKYLAGFAGNSVNAA